MPTTPLLSSAEVCDRLQIERSTLSRWVNAGRIEPAQKLPGIRGAYLFTEQSVDTLRADLRQS